ncbi:MAG: aspartate/glutamate racemase family protein [Pseudomonadota bacterium]
MRSVGILGSVAPEATVLLMQKLLDVVPETMSGAGVPLVVHHNPQMPDRLRDPSQGGGVDPMPVLVSMAQDLERAGVAALATPCLFTHHYALAISHATTLPFLNMIELVADDLAASGAKRVAMRMAPEIRRTGLFDMAFGQRGLTQLWAESEHAKADCSLSHGSGWPAATDPPAGHAAPPVMDCLDCLASGIVAFARADGKRLDVVG